MPLDAQEFLSRLSLPHGEQAELPVSPLILMVEEAGIGLAALDRHGVVLAANRPLRQILGLTVQAMRDILLRDRGGSEAARTPAEWLADPNGLSRLERMLVRPDGTRVWVRLTVSPIPATVERPEHFLALIEDISEHHRSSYALQESEAKYRTIFESALEGIYQTSEHGRFLTANPALARMLGYDSVDDLKAGLNDIGRQLYVDPTRRKEFIDGLGQEQQIEDFISRVYRKDGKIIWIAERGRAVRDAHGRLLYYEGMMEEVTDRKTLEERLRHDALHDVLTGLPNRALFLDRLDKTIHRTERSGASYAVMFIDCDRFKLINDSLGHLAGDRLLVEMARRVSGALRLSDTLARLGGDEFAVLAEDLDNIKDAEVIAGRIRTAVAEPFILNGAEHYLTASIGIAWSPASYRNSAELLRDADTAMYEAKARGRNRFIVFEPGMHQSAVSQLHLGNGLHRALERKELFVQYQPIVRLDSSRLAGFEALVRWRDPLHGVIAPGEFIPIAESIGLINAIDRQVTATAAGHWSGWRERHGHKAMDLFMSVNLSVSELRRPEIVDEVAALLRMSGIPPNRVTLELTETGIMENPERVRDTLISLKAVGVSLALDDFGTGYSSLAYLHRFPFDILKVDRSFILPLPSGGEHLEFVRMIQTLGHSLGMAVLAEGVETAEHDIVLRQLGYTFGQGWFYGYPLDAQDAEALLVDHHLSHPLASGYYGEL